MTLKTGGRRLWAAVTDEYELRPDELRTLENACRATDRADRVAAELAKGPLTVPGSAGQPVGNPLLAEAARLDALIASLLARLKLTSAEDAAKAHESASAKARRAAVARWDPARRDERNQRARDAAG